MEVTSQLFGAIHVCFVAFFTRFFLPPQGYQKEDRDHEPHVSPESILCYVLVMAHLHLVPARFTGISNFLATHFHGGSRHKSCLEHTDGVDSGLKRTQMKFCRRLEESPSGNSALNLFFEAGQIYASEMDHSRPHMYFNVHVIFSKDFCYPGSVHTYVCYSCILRDPPGFLARVVTFVVAVVAILSTVTITSIVAIVVVHRRRLSSLSLLLSSLPLLSSLLLSPL